MKVLEPGHYYVLDNLDDDTAVMARNRVRLYFVKRVGDGYPGNQGVTSSGPICQEVLRAMIDRIWYLDGQIPHVRNLHTVEHLRNAFRELEYRAAEERGDVAASDTIATYDKPELEPACPTCGHLLCRRHGAGEAREVGAGKDGGG